MKELYVEFEQGKMHYYDNQEDTAGKDVLVFLHGWGQSFHTFSKITDFFSGTYRIIGVDFLGFGNSDEPIRPMTVDDYTKHLALLLKELNIDCPILIGHSFGGRIAIKYATKFPVKQLFLISTAGIRKHGVKYYCKLFRYKFLKRIFRLISKERYQKLIASSGSSDYKNASPIMKQTLSNIVRCDQKRDIKKISVNTYLFWGIHDTVTPYTDGMKIRKILPVSKLIPFYQSGHFCYLQEENKFIQTLGKLI